MIISARKVLLTAVFACAVAPGWAQDSAKEQVVYLKDEGRLVLRTDDAMGHYDAAGRPVIMKEEAVMIAKDGTRILMSNGTLWSPGVNRDAPQSGR